MVRTLDRAEVVPLSNINGTPHQTAMWDVEAGDEADQDEPQSHRGSSLTHDSSEAEHADISTDESVIK